MTIDGIVGRSVIQPVGRPVNGVGAFAPTDISELKLWLDASDASTLTLRAGVFVEEWRDKSGQDNHFSQATEARQPSWGADEVNFAATLANMTAGSNYIFSESDGLSIIALAQNPAVTGLTRFFFDFGLFSTAGYGIGYVQDRATIYTPANQTSPLTAIDGNYHRVMDVIDFSNNQKLYYDNVEKISDNISVSSLTAANIAESPTQVNGVSGPMTIGKRSSDDLTTRAFTGKMKQLLIYAKKLTIQERTALDSYLAGIP
jgi:hypothetical protein